MATIKFDNPAFRRPGSSMAPSQEVSFLPFLPSPPPRAPLPLLALPSPYPQARISSVELDSSQVSPTALTTSLDGL